MSTEILINMTATETRLAVVRAALVQAIAIEEDHTRSLVGNIYKGRIERILPGLQAAFVDIGLAQPAFLSLTELPGGLKAVTKPPKEIIKHFQQGQVLLVQVIKDPYGDKGARVATCLSLAGRYMVWVPQGESIAISPRIMDPARRTHLERIMEASGHKAGGWIVRTVAANVSDATLQQQMTHLQDQWRTVQEQAATASTGTLVWQEWPLALRTLRDHRDYPLPTVHIDDLTAFTTIRQWLQHWMPEWLPQLQHYTDVRPIFDTHGVEAVLQQALSKKVNLPSGGQLVIDETEAMVTIDVNTAAFVGSDFAATVLQTNVEAAVAIAHQLRLRRLGGVIIIDFIDMVDATARTTVHKTLARALAEDPVRTKISEISNLGLVTLTRKRTEKSLRQLLYTECPTCAGDGQIKAVTTIVFEIMRVILQQATGVSSNHVRVLASVPVADYLLKDAGEIIQTLSAHINRPITIQAQTTYALDQYNVGQLT